MTSLVDSIAQRIQAEILAGRIEPGSRLRQEQLAELFGVSRTPIREALRKLEAMGLIETNDRRGAVITLPTARGIRDAFMVRSTLEGLAAELATKWISDEQVARLRHAEHLFEASVDGFVTSGGTSPRSRRSSKFDWAAANDAFHEVVQEAAGNPTLKKLIDDLHVRFPRNLTWLALSRDSRLLTRNATEHRLIRESIEAGDSSRARRLMSEHVLSAGELIADVIERASAHSDAMKDSSPTAVAPRKHPAVAAGSAA